MRITIGHKKTGKIQKIIEVTVIDPDPYNDNVLYVVDTFGNYITLTFLHPEIKRQCLHELNTSGCATTFCDIQYYSQQQNLEEYDREIDPFEMEEIQFE